MSETRAEGRAGSIIALLYDYAAAVVGVGFMIGGAVTLLIGVREGIFPSDEAFKPIPVEGEAFPNEVLRSVLHGAAFLIPGIIVAWRHLAHARTGEARPTGAFWGSSLYFHLVAFIALMFLMGGSAGSLVGLSDVVLNDCPSALAGQCFPTTRDSIRSMLDALIFVIVAAPIWWWHLRQGRRLTAPAA